MGHEHRRSRDELIEPDSAHLHCHDDFVITSDGALRDLI
jgi:hypothetical protein